MHSSGSRNGPPKLSRPPLPTARRHLRAKASNYLRLSLPTVCVPFSPPSEYQQPTGELGDLCLARTVAIMGQRSKSIAHFVFLPSRISGLGCCRSSRPGSIVLLCSAWAIWSRIQDAGAAASDRTGQTIPGRHVHSVWDVLCAVRE